MKPISIQLYSLREQAEGDFTGVLKQVAKIGYKGVEPAGFFGLSAGDVRNIVDDLGMVVSSSHSPWPGRNNINEVIETSKALGTDLVVCGFGPEEFADLDTIKKTADTTNFILEKVNSADLRLAVHNHHWEFCRLDGRLIYDIFMEMCPGLLCELDTYWAANFGENDPAEQVAKYKGRTVLLHIKDGPLVKDKAHTAVGSGKMDIPSVIKAADENVLEWLIVEIDSCDTDMFGAVEESFKYLVDAGLGYGN